MYVPTEINSADITTSLMSPNTFVSCELWRKGPGFLQFENIDMPSKSLFRLGKVFEEQKAETVLFAGTEKTFGIGKVIDNSQFRSLKATLGKVKKVCSGEISTEEMDTSIKLWIKHEQLFVFTKGN